jgi:Cu/Ag efflux protein CusF
MSSKLKAGLAASVLSLALAAAGSGFAAAPITRTEKVTGVATVKSVDHATRHVTVTTAGGETLSLKVAQDSKALALKPGDKIKATYVRETELVLSAPNKPLPKDEQAVAVARTADAGPPGALAASRLVVTGAVLRTDTAKHTLTLVSPQGGQTHTVAVRPENYAALAKLKPGDKITATVTEALLLSASPAP